MDPTWIPIWILYDPFMDHIWILCGSLDGPSLWIPIWIMDPMCIFMLISYGPLYGSLYGVYGYYRIVLWIIYGSL